MNCMKKVAVCMSFIMLLLLAACGTGDKTDISITEEVIQETEKVNPVIGGESVTKDEDAIDTSGIMAENVGNPPEQYSSDAEVGQLPKLEENGYKSVLLGKNNFICTSLENKSLNISEIGQAVTDDDSITVSATKFAMIDLDGDWEDEVILWLQINGISDYGFEVLRCQDGEVYGYTLQYREFMNLRDDGTFMFSNGAADYGVGKITFTSTEYAINKLGYSQSEYDSNNELIIQYFANNESCSEDEFNEVINGQEQKPDAMWYDLSDDNINVVF